MTTKINKGPIPAEPGCAMTAAATGSIGNACRLRPVASREVGRPQVR
jgi:hypothetical protein